MKLSEIITEGANILKKKNIPSYLVDSEILMGKILDKKREFIILNQNLKINENDYSKYIKLINNTKCNIFCLTTFLVYLAKGLVNSNISLDVKR